MSLTCRILGHEPDKVEERWPIIEFECERCGAHGMKVTGSTLHGFARIRWE